MEFTFPWPMSQGEWLAWSAAVVTILFGLAAMFMPGTTLKLLRLQTRPEKPEALSESRATISGFYLGVGLTALLLAQPMLYLALAAGWLITAFGRIISMMSDRGNTLFNWTALAVEAALAVLAGAWPLGFIP